MVTNTIAAQRIGVRAMSSENERLVLMDIPGFGIVYNELPKVAGEMGFDIASLGRAADVSFRTAQRIWNNEATGLTFETLVKLLVALNKPFHEVFPFKQHPKYWNPIAYDGEDL